MNRKILSQAMITALLIIAAQDLTAINTSDTRMLSQPAAGGSHIAFIYAEDLWVMNADGTGPRRLTVDEGIESDPCFSPDGKLIAFSAQYDGNTDVFVIPVEGGIPTRLTWHPGNDMVRGFTPDGRKVLFISQRESFTGRYAQLYTVGIDGGYPEKMEIPNAYYASWSPDGRRMAYTPLSPAHAQWKNYRGGTVSTIWLYTFTDHSVVKIPQPEGRCNDTEPMWTGDRVYFLSDRNGEFNLFSYSIDSREIEQLTHFSDFPVLNASYADNMIVFEQGGYLHTFDPASGTEKKLTVAIAADLLELRQRYVKGAGHIRSADISPTGSRAVFGYRGDIVTLPAEKGDQRNITETTGANERFPSWSPDGKTIAYFSDATGEYALYLKQQDGKGDPRIFTLDGTGFYAYPKWSPDSKKISFTDNGRNLYILDIPSSTITKIDSDELYFPGPFRNMSGDWSTDSRWIVYTRLSQTFYRVVCLYSLDQQKSFPVTDGLSDASEPVFDPNGEYLYFFASTDAGPVINWFDLSAADMRMTNSIYLVTLRKDITSPFTKESDEEKGIEEKSEADRPAAATTTKGSKKVQGKAASVPEEKEKRLKIETDGIHDRIVSVPVAAGNYEGLGVAGTGEILYIVRPQDRGASTLHRYNVSDRKDEEVMELDYYVVSADRTKMLYNKGQTTGITAAGKKPEPGKGVLNTASLTVKIDPVAEWPQIFDEAWRINRDYFYDPGMHGVDWGAVKEKYTLFLPDLACRSDLNRVIQWMCSEIGVGHHRVGGGERLYSPQRVGGGLLGADFSVENNRYRLQKIYGGLNWNPDLRSPLTEPGLNIAEGDYILAIDGKDVTADRNIYSFLENTEGKIVELTVGQNPDYTGSRTIRVVPVASESSLRNRDWVEGNLRKVTEATDGKVAYVYVPNTADAGHEYFKRYFFPQANRKAIIIDERFNGGGLIADYYIDLLQRPLQSYWNMRYGRDLKTPSASIQGPKVMIIDETAGSGGDMLPWMFRKFNVGTLVGKRTWGGLVGTLGFPELMDGGSVTAPNLAIWTEDGFVVENVGVPPDIEVEQWPADILEGRDPQLEKAIEVALKELERNPPEEPVRPPYPVKARKQQKRRSQTGPIRQLAEKEPACRVGRCNTRPSDLRPSDTRPSDLQIKEKNMYDHKYLFEFTTAFFMSIGCSRSDAEAVASVLIAAELRGHASHGMLRIKDYFDLWKAGRANVRPEVKVVHETPSTAVVDGGGGFGMVAGIRSMKLAIEKASATGTGWVATRNSNHFGIAGYYAMMALEHDMVGICVTNGNPLVVPTLSISRYLGTNPLAVAIPALNEPPFVADFATTPIARGKLAVAEKKGEKVPLGYVQDADGNPSDDPAILRRGGGMLPLGGDHVHGSHKGYCMAAVVDIFSSLFSGANFGPFVPPSVAYLPVPETRVGEGTGHFFGAMRVDAFRPADEFKSAMDQWIKTFRSARPAKGETMVLIPGDPEREAEKTNRQSGIKLVPAVVEDLKVMAAEQGMSFMD